MRRMKDESIEKLTINYANVCSAIEKYETFRKNGTEDYMKEESLKNNLSNTLEKLSEIVSAKGTLTTLKGAGRHLPSDMQIRFPNLYNTYKRGIFLVDIPHLKKIELF